jgi:hypothetical protein
VSRESARSISFEPDDAKVEAVREVLISWFEENGRDLCPGGARVILGASSSRR